MTFRLTARYQMKICAAILNLDNGQALCHEISYATRKINQSNLERITITGSKVNYSWDIQT